MNRTNLLHLRLTNLQIAEQRFKKPDELVSWLCAIQAQDYGQGKHSIGIRIPGITDTEVEKNIRSKKIIRAWLLRGTLHMASAKDVYWLLELLAPRFRPVGTSTYRELDLDQKTLTRCIDLLQKIMAGGKALTREEITTALQKIKVDAKGRRLAHILYYATAEKLICLGTKHGAELTYALLSEMVPDKKSINHEEALGEFIKRYFQSHGPATLADFVWWSGLSLSDAKKGLAISKNLLNDVNVEGQNYWMVKERSADIKSNSVFLLPGFDEYIIAYKDRSLCIDEKHKSSVITKNGLFSPTLIINGQVQGVWKRTFKKDEIMIDLQLFTSVSQTQKKMITSAFEQYSNFIEKPIGDILIH